MGGVVCPFHAVDLAAGLGDRLLLGKQLRARYDCEEVVDDQRFSIGDSHLLRLRCQRVWPASEVARNRAGSSTLRNVATISGSACWASSFFLRNACHSA